MKRPAALLALCGALVAGATAAQPAAPQAEARRLMDDLLTETHPAFMRDAGALADRPNRLLAGRTRPRPSPVAGVCELDLFSILARPEREPGSPAGQEPDGPVIRSIESERRYELAERPPPRTVPPALASERDCAALADDPALQFFGAPNAGAVGAVAECLTWLTDHPAALAAARCPPTGCPTRAVAAAILRRSAIIGIVGYDTCSRTRAACYQLLLRDGDSAWAVDFWAGYGAGRDSFGGVRFHRQPLLVMD